MRIDSKSRKKSFPANGLAVPVFVRLLRPINPEMWSQIQLLEAMVEQIAKENGLETIEGYKEAIGMVLERGVDEEYIKNALAYLIAHCTELVQEKRS